MRLLALQIFQLVLMVAVAPLLTGFVRLVKARLTGRRGQSMFQPYRDLARLLRKEVAMAENASWLYRVCPYLIFAVIWVAALIIPTYANDLILTPTADLIALVALLGTARFLLALAGMDVGTSFGGLGASREMMIAALAEPAMLMVTFTMALFAGTTSLPDIATFFITHPIHVSISIILAFVALLLVAVAENARIPVDNPATHLELTMVHEAMVLEYSGRHLAMIESAAMLKMVLYISLIACLFAPWGIALDVSSDRALALGVLTYLGKLALGGFALAVFETSIAKFRLFRVPEFLGGALLLGVLAVIFCYVSQVS